MSVKVHVIGRLGADADVKQTKQGKEFSTFNVAVDDFLQGKKTTTWFAVADFSDVAARRAEFLKKGSMIEVQGIETCRVYVDRNNLPQIARDIRATHIDFISLGTKQDKETEAVDCGTLKPTETVTTEVTVTNVIPQPQEAAVATSASATSDFVDDLPF